MTRRGVAIAVLVMALGLPGRVLAEPEATAGDPAPESTAGDHVLHGLAIGVDLLVLRPVAAVTTAIGAVLFVPAAAISLPGGKDSVRNVWEILVVTPAREVYDRPLGDL